MSPEHSTHNNEGSQRTILGPVSGNQAGGASGSGENKKTVQKRTIEETEKEKEKEKQDAWTAIPEDTKKAQVATYADVVKGAKIKKKGVNGGKRGSRVRVV